MNRISYLAEFANSDTRKKYVESAIDMRGDDFSRITLIKLFRETTGAGLREAKETVESVPEFFNGFMYRKTPEFMAKVAEFFGYDEKAKQETLLSGNAKRGTVARWSDMLHPIVVDYVDNLFVWVWESEKRGAIERAQWDYNVKWESLVPF